MVNEKNMPQPLLIGLLIIGGGLIIVAFYLGFVLLNSNTKVHAATEATTVAEIATHLATIQPTPTRIVTATPSAVPLPNSCAMLKQQQPTAEDGPHTIYLQGKTAVTLYCHNMADIPTEYLTLPATANGGNFSLISYPEGAIVTLTVPEVDDSWHIRREGDKWRQYAHLDAASTTTVVLPADVAWRLFTKGLSSEKAEAKATVTGDEALAEPLFKMVSIMA